MARFVDQSYLSQHYQDHEKDGVFPKNPQLKNFVTSAPAIAAG
jgi:hypothetical protein